MNGSTNSRKRVALSLASGTVFWAHAPATTASATISRFTAQHSTLRLDHAIDETPRHVGDDKDAIIARFVGCHPAVAVHAGDPLAIGLIVWIERQRQPDDVEREP